MKLRGRLLETGRIATVVVEGTQVVSVEDEAGDPDAPRDGEVVLTPGLVDIQVNGLHGADLNGSSLDVGIICQLVHEEWCRGVTTFCPTLTSAPEAQLLERLRVIALARTTDPLFSHSVLPAHVEGPYISAKDGPRGAHGHLNIRPPDVGELDRWLEAAGGSLSIVTVAPELPAARCFIMALVERGIVAAIGHTAASAADVVMAVEAGASLATHLGNGCAELLHRHHNPIWPQLADDRLSASFIADGVHLPEPMLVAMLRAKGIERSILVSDSIGTTGAVPGRYQTKDGQIEVGTDRVSRPVGSTGFAGGARSLEGCLSWAVSHARLSWVTAIRLASGNPACLLGLDGEHADGGRGRIAPGSAGDLAVFRMTSGELVPVATVVQGQIVFRTGAAAEAVEEARSASESHVQTQLASPAGGEHATCQRG